MTLRCDKCGGEPAPDIQAKLGGTHYRVYEHGVGIPGRQPTRNARKCGKWVEVPR